MKKRRMQNEIKSWHDERTNESDRENEHSTNLSNEHNLSETDGVTEDA